MVEYLLIAGIAVALLAFPIDGHPSVVDMLFDAIKTFYAKFLAAISLPQ